MSEDEEIQGLDLSQHGEEGYNLGMDLGQGETINRGMTAADFDSPQTITTAQAKLKG